jgi:hypothetical protein
MQPNPERRKHPRTLTAELIRFSFPLSFECFLAELINIGRGGLGLKCDFRTETGLLLFIRPFAAGGYGFCSRIDSGCPAQVKWCKTIRRSNRRVYTFGVEFQTGTDKAACRF